MSQGPLLIAIDGPAGVGKSATARELARLLGLPYLDTGAMYRSVALAAARAGFGPDLPAHQHERIVEIARSCEVELVGDSAGQRVILGGEDVTAALREPEVTQMSSVVSAIPDQSVQENGALSTY